MLLTDKLPYGLTPEEAGVLKDAFKAGYFEFEFGDSKTKTKPRTPKLEDIARDSDKTLSNFSHLLGNARRKVIHGCITQNFDHWIPTLDED